MFNSIFAPFLFFLFFQPDVPTNNASLRQLLATKNISLENRYENKFVSDVFKDNILLNIAYLSGKITKKDDINWEEIKKPVTYKFTLAPKKTFAFHEDVLPQYRDSVVKTTNAHFNLLDGFKSDGYLAGDGVCHLASLMYWAAKTARLDAYAPTDHNFAVIPEIPKEFGVSIYSMPGASQLNAMQNLYITNSKKNPMEFAFDYDAKKLTVSVYEVKENQHPEALILF